MRFRAAFKKIPAHARASRFDFEMEEEDLKTWPSIWAWETEGGCLRVLQLAAARYLEAKGLAVPGELDLRHVSYANRRTSV